MASGLKVSFISGTIMAHRSAHLSKKFQQGIRLSFDRALFDGSAVPPQITTLHGRP
jgi:hypothetical protein